MMPKQNIKEFILHAGLLLNIIGMFCPATIALGDAVVTTYITRVQEERHDTRWTLTEWLRIKERMKLMDVWLSMFSEGKKNVFRPELNLTYLKTSGIVADSSKTIKTQDGTQGRAQLWLTNLISSTVGIRTLNVDFGVEGFKHSSTDQTPAVQIQGQSVAASSVNSATQFSYYAGVMRVFGQHIQDTSLVFKYGEYRYNTGQTGQAPLGSSQDSALSTQVSGPLGGAELDIYITKWLGIEGQYLAMRAFENEQKLNPTAGQYADGFAFIEVSLLRLMIGQYGQKWSISRDGVVTESTATGLTAGVKLQL